ncbi:MAG: xylulokinase [Actinomycetota bacterium]|nr:xylulokinase [Actinomycetota bacterium]
MTGRKVIGVDSSTQSCKVVLCAADTGEVLATGRADHPDSTEVDPAAWWAAFEHASDGLLDQADAISVAGQQHGMVALDDTGAVVRNALLWNDLRSAPDADDLVAELSAPEWASATGSVPGASFTISKLRWLARCEPDNAARTAAVLLPHDWLTGQLAATSNTGTPAPIANAITDAGDASGTGYFSPATRTHLPELAERALGHRPALPRIAEPAEQVGTTRSGAAIGPGTGDNMGAALGLGAEPGDAIVSLGTSGTVFGVSDGPTADPTGAVAGFADATGRFLPLVCTLNAARVLGAAASMLGVDLAGLELLALQAAPGASGVVLLPYLDGERTPNLPAASGSLHGLTRSNMTPANIARAAVEGMLCGLVDGVDALTAARGNAPSRLLLIGGASASRAVRAVLPALFGGQVRLPAAAEYVALGAARQAAWVLAAAGGAAAPADVLPQWTVPATDLREPTDAELAGGVEVRRRYAEVRVAAHGA